VKEKFTALSSLVIFYYYLISNNYRILFLLIFDKNRPIFALRVGNGVGKKQVILSCFTGVFKDG